MSSTTRRSLLKMASLSAAAFAGAGNFLHADQVVGQAQPVTSEPEKQTPAKERPAHDVRTLYFADNWEDADGFVADTYLEVTPVYDRWMKACSLFPMWRGETGFRYNDYYASRAAACGCLSQCSKAVCFMSPADERVRDLRRV
jgi:hypothetical protein